MFDKHCEIEESDEEPIISTIEDEYFHEMNGRSLQDNFIGAVSMDWSSSGNINDPHRDTQEIMNLSDFQAANVIAATAKTSSRRTPRGDASNSPSSRPTSVPDASELIRGEYRKYTVTQINKLLYACIVGDSSASSAGIALGIAARSAQNYVRIARKIMQEELEAALTEVDSGDEDNSCSDFDLEPLERKRGNQKLFKRHTLFFLRFFEDHADATLSQAKEALLEEFDDILDITTSAISKHLAVHCNLTMKKLERIPEARNSMKNLEKRRIRILEWQNLPDFDYRSNCVFIDEAGFNLHIRRTFGRSVRGKPAKTTVPTQRGVTITILGAMCEKGIVNLTVRRPSAVASKKKRKLTIEAGVAEVNGRVGTRTTHYLDFLAKTMDHLDEHGLQGRYIVMDNAPIHKSTAVETLIISRGYKLAYLPTYSPFLNPIEEMWSKIKFGVKRNEVTDRDTLIPRIVQSAQMVTVNDCEGWIGHSLTFFDRCIAMERML